MHRMEKMNSENFFSLSLNTTTQGHLMNLMGNRFSMVKRKYFIR